MSKKLEKFLNQASKDLQKNKFMIGGIVGGIFGAQAAGKGERSARDAMSEILGNLSRVKAPTLEELQVNLQMLKEAGILTPEMEAEILMDPAKLALVTDDPIIKDIQMQSLESLQKRETAGLGPQSRAALNEARAQVATAERGSREAILQNMAARGMGGSGSELAAQLANQQGSAQTAAMQGDQIAANADKQALEALSQKSNLASNMRSQDLSSQSANQQARNAANQFNTQLLAGRETRNVGERNDSQRANLSNKQRVADTNANIKNQESMYNSNMRQQVFNNDMAKAGAVNNALGDKAQMDMTQGYNRAAMYGQMGGAFDKGAQDIAKMVAMGGSDRNMKKNIHDGESKLNAFLEDITNIVKKHKKFSGGEMDPSALEAFTSDSGNYSQVDSGMSDTSNYGDMQTTGESTPIGTNEDTGMQGAGGGKQSAGNSGQGTSERNPMPSFANMEFSRANDTPGSAQGVQYKMDQQTNPFMMSNGGPVPGKPKHNRNHIENDVVPAALSPGEIVIPIDAIKKGRKGIDAFLDGIEAKSYKYKDPKKPLRGEGTYVSPMAQDLEKTELGKDMVINTPEGKIVDYGKGFGTLLAAQALLKEKIDEIEKKLGKKNGKK